MHIGAGVPDVEEDGERLVIGLLTSVGETLDSFFVEIVGRWRSRGAVVVAAAGSPASSFGDPIVLDGVSRTPSLENWRSMRSLRAWVQDNHIDVVVTNTATASMLVRVAKVGVPVIYFCHGLHWNGKRLSGIPFRLAERALLSKTDGVVCINSDDERWFSERAPNLPRLRLLMGVGLDVERFVRKARLPWREGYETIRLVWCGELTDRKNPADAVKLARVLRVRGIDVCLDMLGDGPLQLSEEVADCVGGAVNHVGRADPVRYFEEADVLVQTSRWEGLPRVALEATAIGIPTVGFDVKGVRDVPGASVVPFGDIEGLADVVLRAAKEVTVDLPDVSTLSYVHAADSLLDFVRSVVSDVYPMGRYYSR